MMDRACAPHRRAVQHAEAAGLAAEEQVFLHRQVGHQAEFLEDRADADQTRARCGVRSATRSPR